MPSLKSNFVLCGIFLIQMWWNFSNKFLFYLIIIVVHKLLFKRGDVTNYNALSNRFDERQQMKFSPEFLQGFTVGSIWFYSSCTSSYSGFYCVFRSIIEPVRNTIFRHADHFHLSHAIDLDIEKKEVKCQSVLKQDLIYNVPFDKLVIGVGALSNTFGVPGVETHAFFLKVLYL